MAMSATDIERFIKEALPDAQVTIRDLAGDGDHYAASVVSAAFKGVNVLDSNELRQGIKDYTNWPTVPQLYVKGEFVGGSDIMMEMFQSGELKQLMTDKGVA